MSTRRGLARLVVLLAVAILLSVIPATTAFGEDGTSDIAASFQQSTPQYRVEFTTSTADVLSDQARQAIVDAVQAWPDAPPTNNTFFVISVRWEQTWALATMTSADLYAPLPDNQETHLSLDNLIALLLVQTPDGWQAAIDVDERVNSLLQYVPLTELSPSAREDIFPSPDLIRRPEAYTPEQQYNNYRLPWPAGHPWHVNGGWHGGTGWGYFNTNHALDFDIDAPETNSDILAAASGTVVLECPADNGHHVFIIRTSGVNEYLGYLHLATSTVTVAQGDEVPQGFPLGRMAGAAPQGSDINCGGVYSTGTHLHFYMPTKPFTIDGYTFSASNLHSGENLYSTNGTTSPAPPNTNLIVNPSFSSGETSWGFWGSIDHQVQNGVLSFWRNLEPDGAVAYQWTNYTVPAGAPLEMSVEIGNSSAVEKTVTVRVRNEEWDGGQRSCVFSIPPNTPLQRYALLSEIGTDFTNLRIEFNPDPADDVPAILLDNVVLRYYPTLDITGTHCIAPNSQTTWDFSSPNGPQGWTIGHSLSDPRQYANTMWYRVVGDDPYLFGPTLTNVAAADYPYVAVTMVSEATGCGQIFFKREGDADFAAGRHVSFLVLPDASTHTYYVDMSSNANWTGNITQLRFDPACNTYDPDAGNLAIASIALTTPPDADLSLTKTVDDTNPNLGSNVTFTLTLANAGPTDATNVEVTDLLPAGLSYVSSTPSQGSYNSGTGVWTVGTLANGAQATLTITATVTGTTGIINAAEVTASDQPDPDSTPGDGTGDDYASVTITPQLPPELTTNAGLSVYLDSAATITQALLEATDPDNTPAELTFTVTGGPTEGTLNLGASFTQQDIDNGLLSYTHNPALVDPNLIYENDSFTFTVSDGEIIIGPFTFDITITVDGLTAGYYQETHPLLNYNTQWKFKAKNAASGGAAVKAKNGAYMDFWFEGDLLILYRLIGQNEGAMQVCIDGDCRLVDNYFSGLNEWTQPVAFGPYPGGVHHVEISRPANEARFWLDAIEVVDLDSALSALPTGVMVHDTDANLLYVGNWLTKTKPAAIGGIVHKARRWYVGVYFHFTGDEFTFYRRVGPVDGSMMVCIDDTCQTVSNYSSVKLWGVPITFSGLGAGPHAVGVYRLPNNKLFFDGVWVGPNPPSAPSDPPPPPPDDPGIRDVPSAPNEPAEPRGPENSLNSRAQ